MPKATGTKSAHPNKSSSARTVAFRSTLVFRTASGSVEPYPHWNVMLESMIKEPRHVAVGMALAFVKGLCRAQQPSIAVPSATRSADKVILRRNS